VKTAWIGILLVALALAAPTALAMPGPSVTAQAPSVTATYTLYGNATSGWGFTASSITEPGPTITASVGETITLELFSNDGVTHNWFLALDGGASPTAGEPSSPDFSSKTTAVPYSFTVPNQIGTFTYRCRIHPTLMTGSFVILAAPTFVLYGSATQGWGSTPTSLSNPGPTLTANQGDSVELALYSQDNVTHEFFVSYDGLQTPSAGEPQSANITSSLVPVFYTFVANQAGNFSYYCKFHPTTMKGTFEVAASGGGTTAPPDYSLYAAAVVIIVIVAIVVAVVIRRKPRTPPRVPPTPPQG
jgi:plastocyanin